MTKVYLLAIPREKERNSLFCDLNFDALPRTVKEKILKTGDEKTKFARIYSYSFLVKILCDYSLSQKELEKKLLFTEKGKPFVEGLKSEFSVSHTDGMVALTISNDGQIGIDIEKVDAEKNEKISKIIKRFCTDVSVTERSGHFECYIYADVNGKITETDSHIVRLTDEIGADFVKWTQLEAMLKCHGGGFEALCELKNTFDSYSTESALIALCGEIYALSVAKKNSSSAV